MIDPLTRGERRGLLALAVILALIVLVLALRRGYVSRRVEAPATPVEVVDVKADSMPATKVTKGRKKGKSKQSKPRKEPVYRDDPLGDDVTGR